MVRPSRLTREEIAKTLEECLGFLAGKAVPKLIRGNLCVLREWDLDSEHGVELACDLCARLGIDIPINDNPLIDESDSVRKRARTFAEVVDHLLKLSNK